jgi:uncharacterized protein with HEPN domain
MLEFAKRVKRRIFGVSLDTFLEDEDVQDLILYAIGQIGENANEISEKERDKHHDILWNSLIGIRNRVFHSYGDISVKNCRKGRTVSRTPCFPCTICAQFMHGVYYG